MPSCSVQFLTISQHSKAAFNPWVYQGVSMPSPSPPSVMMKLSVGCSFIPHSNFDVPTVQACPPRGTRPKKIVPNIKIALDCMQNSHFLCVSFEVPLTFNLLHDQSTRKDRILFAKNTTVLKTKIGFCRFFCPFCRLRLLKFSFLKQICKLI